MPQTLLDVAIHVGRQPTDLTRLTECIAGLFGAVGGIEGHAQPDPPHGVIGRQTQGLAILGNSLSMTPHPLQQGCASGI